MYRITELSADKFNNTLSNNKINKVKYALLKKAGSVTLYNSFGKPTFKAIREKSKFYDPADSELTIYQVRNFFGIIKKSINKFIIDNNFSIAKLPENKNCRGFNRDAWNKIKVGELFYEYDFNEFYWQIMYQQGLINKKTFEKYRAIDEYKTFRNISISRITTIATQEFYRDGESKPYLLISEKKESEQIIYNNVITVCRNIISHAAEIVGNENALYWNTDAIAVSVEYRDIVDEFLSQTGFEYKVDQLKKISKSEYEKPGGYIRKF